MGKFAAFISHARCLSFPTRQQERKTKLFRLVKVINGNIQYEVVRLNYVSSSPIGVGCALSCSNGNTSNASATVMPDYISMTDSESISDRWINGMLVNEDMIFKVEFTGTAAPAIGMSVGLATDKYKMDAVAYNSSGKGKIIDIDDGGKYVYVKFRK